MDTDSKKTAQKAFGVCQVCNICTSKDNKVCSSGWLVRAHFLSEYNRLAKLAADAPDIHIYHQDPRQKLAHLNAVPTPAPLLAPVHNPAFNAYSYTANLGDNQQFFAGPNTFPAQAVHQAGHLAGHLAGHQAPAPAPVRVPAATFAPVPTFNTVHDAPPAKWTGPVADTVPAGLSGRTVETDAVKAARASLYRAHANALGGVVA